MIFLIINFFKMNLRGICIDISKKVIIIVVLIFFALTAAFTFSYNTQLSNFLELEHTDTLEHMERVQENIKTEQEYLDNIIQDWASWNDSYIFIKDGNQQFIDSNIQNGTFTGLKINTIVYVNKTGSVVYAKALDLYTGEEEPVPVDFLKLIENGTASYKIGK